MTISVALCTYNGAKYVEEQLTSIAAQSVLPSELIVCDDCSDDDTPNIVRRFARTSMFPVHLVVNEVNIGFPNNFAAAIGRCHGDAIALCDQDDVWYPHKLARLEETLQAHPSVGLVFSNADVVDAQLQSLGYDLWTSHRFSPRERRAVARGASLDVLLRLPIMMGASMIFRASYVELILPVPRGWGHDQWIGTLLAAVAGVTCVDESLFQYRQHGANQFGAYRHMSLADRLRLPVDDRARVESYVQALQRYRELLARLDGVQERWPYPIAHRARILEKIHHLEARASMTSGVLRRISSVFGELRTGRYHRYSDGMWSAARDLVR